MALITSEIGSGAEAVGANSLRVHAESVMDMVFDKSATKTPWVSMLTRNPIRAKTAEIIVDKMVTVDDPITLARDEGGGGTYTSDFDRDAASTHQKRLRLGTMVQNFRDDVEVHDINQALDAFGVADEYNYQGKKKMKRLAIGVEKRIFQDTFLPTDNVGWLGTSPDSWADPTLMKPFIQQMQHGALSLGFVPNRFAASDMQTKLVGAAELDSGGVIWDGSGLTAQTRLNEDIVHKAMEIGEGAADDAEVTFDTCLLPTAPYGHVGNFGSVGSPASASLGEGYGPLQIQKDMMLAKVARVVKIAGTQHGDVAFVKTRWIHQGQNVGTSTSFARGADPQNHPLFNDSTGTPGNYGNVIFCDKQMCDLAVLRPILHVPLPKQGDSTIGMLTGDLTFRLKHPQAALVIFGVNNL